MSEKGSKNKSSSVVHSKKKVIFIQPWDDRFWIGEKPVDESYFEKMRKPQKLEKEGRNRNPIKKAGQEVISDKSKYLDKSADSRPPVSITMETLNELKSRIEEEWESKGIPHYFRETFRKSVFLLSRHKAVAIITRELEELKRNRSSVQTAIDAVKAREEGIKNIKEMLEYFSKSSDWENSEELCSEVIEILNAYRILTLNAVESIIKWKEQLVYALILNKSDSIGKHKTLQFMWEDHNYIIKMRDDMNFLYNSAFMKIFNFSDLPDPLLIVPSKPIEKKTFKTNERLKFLSIPNMLAKRVKLADRYILDEEREESQATEAPKVSKRMDEKVAKKILEEIVEINNEKTLKEYVEKLLVEEKKNAEQAVAKKVTGSIVKEVVLQAAKDIASHTYYEAAEGPMKKHMDGLLGKYIDDELDKIIKAIIKEEMKNAKTLQKEQAKNENKLKKDKDLVEKKKRDEEAALMKKMQREKEENEKKLIREKEELERKNQREKEENEKRLKKEREDQEKKAQREMEENERRLQKEKEDYEKKLLKEKLEHEKKLQMEKEENDRRLRKEKEDKEKADKRLQEEREANEKRSLKEREEYEKQKKRTAEENDQISKHILESLLKELHLDIEKAASSTYKEELDTKMAQSQKAQMLINSQLAENLLRLIIEEEINALNIKTLAESLLNEAFEERKAQLHNEQEKKLLEQRERQIQNDKISDSIFTDLLEIHLSRMDLENLSEKMIERVSNFRTTLTINSKILKNLTADPDDYAVDEFTPGEHSPREYDPNDDFANSNRNLDSPRRVEELAYEFANSLEFSNIDSMNWVPIHVHEKNIEEIFSDYYSNLMPVFLSVCPDVHQLIMETIKGIDACWYWGVKDSKIIGALVYSLDYLSADRKIVVHHLSSINQGLMEKFINAATELLFSIDTCNEIRVNLLMPFGKELPSEIKKVFTNLKFKWKASAESGVPGHDLNVMGKIRTQAAGMNARTGEVSPFTLKCGCLVEPSESSVAANLTLNEEMIQVGNRQCQVNALLNLFGKLDKSGIQLTSSIKTRLQGEISDILEIINSTDSFNFPNIVSLVSDDPKQAAQFLNTNNLLDFTTTQKSSISILDLSLKFISCTNITHSFNSADYKFLRFKSPEILVGSEFRIFSIPTNLPYIRALFLSFDGLKEELMAEMRRDKTDLFYKLESMLKSVSYSSQEAVEFTIPVFKKKASWIVSWMQGYEIPPQRDEHSSQFVKKCYETVKIGIESPKPAAGLLNLSRSKGYVFENPFVFCLTHTGLDRVLDMPLFVCLVEQSDWIAS